MDATLALQLNRCSAHYIIKAKLELKTTVLELAYIGCSRVGLYHVGYSLAQWLKSSLTKKHA